MAAIALIAVFGLGLSADAKAQSAARVYRVAFLNVGPAAPNASNVKAFRDGMREHGYVEGRNLEIDFRWADNRVEALPGLISELLLLKPDVFVSTGGPPTILALKKSATTIPVVFITGDPVAEGIVPNLAKPGGTMTGFAALAANIEGKRLELLRQALPKATRVAIIWNPGVATAANARKDAAAAAAQLGMTVEWREARNGPELDMALASLPAAKVDAILVIADPVLGFYRKNIVDAAARNRLPGIFYWRDFVVDGGLMSYGTNLAAIYKRTARYVDKILKGTSPADLPIEQPITFEFVVNRTTAKALGITLPQALLMRADEVIRQHHVEHDHLGPIFLHQHAGVETGGGDLDVEAAIFFEELGHDFDQFDVVIDQQDLTATAFEGVGRDAVVLHELVEHFARDAAKARPRDPKALELPVVEATDDGLLADLANLRSFACRENGLHGYIHPCRPQPTIETGPQYLSSTRRRRTEIFLDLPLLNPTASLTLPTQDTAKA